MFGRKPKPEPEAPKAAQCAHTRRTRMPATLRSREGWLCTDCGAEGVGA